MMPPSERIVQATMPYTLRPKKNDREKVIAAALEFLIEEYSYTPWDFGYNDIDVIDVKDVKNLIEELRSTVTLEEPSQHNPQHTQISHKLPSHTKEELQMNFSGHRFIDIGQILFIEWVKNIPGLATRSEEDRRDLFAMAAQHSFVAAEEFAKVFSGQE